MRFEPATEIHQRIFAEWNRVSRLEERTCRPITRGKRTSTVHPIVTLAFFIDRVENPVGRFVYFDVNPRNRSAEFGYIIHPNFRQQGIGYRMLTLAIRQLFTTTDLNKLYCQTGAFNTASISLLEKLQFHRDGILREHHELDGKLWDDFIYSLLRREWGDHAS
ncbi:MAG: GNAT family protein [Cyanobacteria bacterium J06638_20]